MRMAPRAYSKKQCIRNLQKIGWFWSKLASYEMSVTNILVYHGICKIERPKYFFSTGPEPLVILFMFALTFGVLPFLMVHPHCHCSFPALPITGWGSNVCGCGCSSWIIILLCTHGMIMSLARTLFLHFNARLYFVFDKLTEKSLFIREDFATYQWLS